MQLQPSDFIPDILKIAVGGIAAFYGSYRAMERRLERVSHRVELLETRVEPIIRWWTRIAQNAADRLFIKQRAIDKENGG